MTISPIKTLTLTLSFISSFFISSLLYAQQKSNNEAIDVNISLDNSLLEQAAPNDTLFVYARAVNGPRMPLAIIKHTVSDLPLKTRLTPDMAMMPQMSLNKFNNVEIVARISKSGNAMTQPGDLYGQSEPINWRQSTESLPVAINKIYQ